MFTYLCNISICLIWNVSVWQMQKTNKSGRGQTLSHTTVNWITVWNAWHIITIPVSGPCQCFVFTPWTALTVQMTQHLQEQITLNKFVHSMIYRGKWNIQKCKYFTFILRYLCVFACHSHGCSDQYLKYKRACCPPMQITQMMCACVITAHLYIANIIFSGE